MSTAERDATRHLAGMILAKGTASSTEALLAAVVSNLADIADGIDALRDATAEDAQRELSQDDIADAFVGSYLKQMCEMHRAAARDRQDP